MKPFCPAGFRTNSSTKRPNCFAQPTAASYAPSAQMSFSRGKRALSPAVTSLTPSRSWTEAAWTTTARSNPMVSTTMCRFRPATRLPMSKPRASPPSAVCTLWLSTIAAEGLLCRPSP
jgi:hypothetical protein